MQSNSCVNLIVCSMTHSRVFINISAVFQIEKASKNWKYWTNPTQNVTKGAENYFSGKIEHFMFFPPYSICLSLSIVSRFKWYLAEFQLLCALFTLLHIVSVCKIKAKRMGGSKRKKETKSIKTKDLFLMIRSASGTFQLWNADSIVQ